MPVFDKHHPTKEEVYNALTSVIDPEVGINIVDMGLVYNVTVKDKQIRIAFTLTTPACPMGSLLLNEVRQAIKSICESDTNIDIELVWEPQWTPNMMSSKAMQALGFN